MLKKIAIAAAIAATLTVPASGAFAAGKLSLTQEIKTEISTKLSDMGYEVRSIQIEGGMYEAKVIKDGVRQEVTLNGEMEIVTGKDND